MPDDESSPGTAPFVPDFDTGAHSQPLESPANDTAAAGETRGDAAPREPVTEQPVDYAPDHPPSPEPLPTPVPSVTVPSRYSYLKWWKLVLVVAGVWIVAAVIGLGLFSWWYHSVNKTPANFVVLVYVVACTVGGLMLAMVPGKPLLSALAIAVVSAVFASLAASAPLYGHYFCEHAKHCVLGLIPY